MAPAGVNAGGRMENRIRRNLAAGVILSAPRAALISLAMLTTPLGGETHPQEPLPSLAVLATSGQLPESGTDRRVARGGARLAPVIRQHAAEGGRERGSAAGRY